MANRLPAVVIDNGTGYDDSRERSREDSTPSFMLLAASYDPGPFIYYVTILISQFFPLFKKGEGLRDGVVSAAAKCLLLDCWRVLVSNHKLTGAIL